MPGRRVTGGLWTASFADGSFGTVGGAWFGTASRNALRYWSSQPTMSRMSPKPVATVAGAGGWGKLGR
ncbi:hypothetical protein [Kibdelosporangium persicum]|uniref:hypothetical protein n=1 Tax=Kibdelosporangium persicum TaxID=2698649 RepID=UPI0015638D02|nr:hypothetical protein [Kibdelosporangium persicum]